MLLYRFCINYLVHPRGNALQLLARHFIESTVTVLVLVE